MKLELAKRHAGKFLGDFDALFSLFQEMSQEKQGFYAKWGKNLKAEMMQGFRDPGETLGSGICFALSMRWTIAELKKGRGHDVEDLLSMIKMGESEAQDRMIQAIGHLKGSKWKTAPEVMRFMKQLGVKSSTDLLVGKDSNQDSLRDTLRTFCLGDEFRVMHQGAGQLMFWWDGPGHAISICCHFDPQHPQDAVYRISDPNFGTFHFPLKPPDYSPIQAQNQFIECLTDLLTKCYSPNFSEISCRCFAF